MSNMGLSCLHTAKIAMYFKGVQVHNCVTLASCMHSNLVGLQAYISSSSTSLLWYRSCNGSREIARRHNDSLASLTRSPVSFVGRADDLQAEGRGFESYIG